MYRNLSTLGFTRVATMARKTLQALPAGDRGRALVVSGRDEQPAHKHWCSGCHCRDHVVERPEQGVVGEDAAAAARSVVQAARAGARCGAAVFGASGGSYADAQRAAPGIVAVLDAGQGGQR
jgi:hypothetical protein